jgi:hypothetical protein
VLAHQFENPALARALDHAEREPIDGDLRVVALDIQTIVQAMVDGAEM